jgi:hypothetical protein
LTQLQQLKFNSSATPRDAALHPIAAWEAAGVQDSPDPFNSNTIEDLSHSILLRSVVNGEFVNSSLFSEVADKITGQVFATAIRMKNFDPTVKLGVRPHLKSPTGLKSVGFVPQEINMGKLRMVICKGDEITTPSNSFNRGWPPYIRVNLPPELGRALASTNLRDRISTTLSISARFIEYRTIG